MMICRNVAWSFLLLVSCACQSLASSSEIQSATPSKVFINTPTAGLDTSTPLVAFKASRSHQVDAIFNKLINQDQPGCAVLVTQDGQVQHLAGYGLADLKSNLPITSQTIFDLGSIGKQFTALAIMLLAEDGKLSYDDPMVKYLPELEIIDKQVTLRNLLNHTSGIYDWMADKEAIEAVFKQSNGHPSNTDVLKFLSNWKPTAYRPGAFFNFNNTGYLLLGSIVERLSGQSYAEFLKDRVFMPLNMQDSFAGQNNRSEIEPLRARGYTFRDGKFVLNETDALNNLAGPGWVYASLTDMTRYDQALFSNRIVNAETLKQAFTPGKLLGGDIQFDFGQNLKGSYGFGWVLSDYKGQPVYWHNGANEGQVAMYTHFPNQDLSVILACNRSDLYSLKESLAYQVADIYLEP